MKRSFTLFSIAFCLVCGTFLSVNSVMIPEEVKERLQKDFPTGKFRLDGVFEVEGRQWLPIIPDEEILKAKSKQNISKEVILETESEDEKVLSPEETVKAIFQEEGFLEAHEDEFDFYSSGLIYRSEEDDYLFTNAWIYTPIKNNTIKSLQFYDDEIKKKILKGKILPNFIIPKGFILPRDLGAIAGHLPLKYRDVELATDREAKYLESLEEELKNGPLKLLTYDFEKDIFTLNSLSFEKGKSIIDPKGFKTLKVDTLENKFSLLSQIKIVQGRAFFIDYNRAAVYTLEERNGEFGLYGFLNVDPKLGLQDFTMSVDGSLSYMLTNKVPKLFVIDNKTGQEIKVLDMPAGPDTVNAYTKDSKDTDFVVVNCKGNNKVLFISSFDHRIVKEIKTGNLPISTAYNKDYLFVANKADKTVTVIDWISRQVVNNIDLEDEPAKILVSPDGSELFVLSSSSANLAIMNISSGEVLKKIDLNPDIIEPKDMVISEARSFLIVGSSNSDSIGIIDINSKSLVKKFNIGSHSNKLILANFIK